MSMTSKRSAVLGHSRGLNPKEIARILINNPFGNASQKTPIVVIKKLCPGRTGTKKRSSLPRT
jgi:hypothetical protein